MFLIGLFKDEICKYEKNILFIDEIVDVCWWRFVIKVGFMEVVNLVLVMLNFFFRLFYMYSFFFESSLLWYKLRLFGFWIFFDLYYCFIGFIMIIWLDFYYINICWIIDIIWYYGYCVLIDIYWFFLKFLKW